jgi:hypothetical protein
MVEALRHLAGVPAATSDEQARFERRRSLTAITAAEG